MSRQTTFGQRILAMFRAFEQPTSEKSVARSSWRMSRSRIVFWTCSFLVTVGVGVYLRAEIHRRTARFEHSSPFNTVRSGGTLLIIGGGQLPELIRHRFIELAGGRNARIVVIPAEATDEVARSQYRAAWSAYEVESIDVLHVDSRTAADQPEMSRMLETATGVWLGGGQQTWLSGWYGQTLVEKRLKQVLERNGVVAGTSAGAAVMSEVMISGGREKPLIGRGFGLIRDAIIDQHFVKRNRFSRMQQALAENPGLVGFGIDEGTAMQYGVESGRFEVLGHSCVVACALRKDAGEHSPMHLQFLNAGNEFDVASLRRGQFASPGFTDIEGILFGE
jgi:cyanophycinase